MESTRPTAPLLAHDSIENNIRKSSNGRSIPRKPVPQAQTQSVPDARDDENHGVGHNDEASSVTAWQPVSTSNTVHPSPFGQTQTATYRSLERQAGSNGEMTGRLRHITLVCAFLVLPLCGITAALLIVTYHNLLPHSNVDDSQTCSGLLVNYGASQLTSLSTWISTVATLHAPAFLALLSYPIAKWMTRDRHVKDRLPSPYQTSLLIELLGGNMVSLWGSMAYILSRKRAQLSRLVPLCFTGLLFAILLGILMQLADFWLHRATHSIIYKVSHTIDAAQYGRELSQYCQDYYETDAGSRYSCLGTTRAPGDQTNPPCSVSCGDATFYPTHFAQGYLLANSLPTNNSLEVVQLASDHGSGAQRSLVLLMPSSIDSNISWSARTVGVSASCEYILRECTESYDGSHLWFSCGANVPPSGYNSSGPIPFNNLNGNTGSSLWLKTLYTQPSDVTVSGKIGNPWIFGLGMNINAEAELNYKDVWASGNFVGTLMMCTSTTYDVEYSVESSNLNGNGSINIDKLIPSNGNIHNTVQGHINFALSANSANYIQNAFLASIFSTDNGVQLLRKFEEEYGKLALSFAAPSFQGSATTSRHNVNQRVVSCVQRAPLWSLVGLVCLYIMLAVILAAVAMFSSSNNNVRSAQSQLSVAGLAAAAFEEKRLQHQYGAAESTEDMFEELNTREQDHIGEGSESEKRQRKTKRVGFTANKVGHYTYDLKDRSTESAHAQSNGFADFGYQHPPQRA